MRFGLLALLAALSACSQGSTGPAPGTTAPPPAGVSPTPELPTPVAHTAIVFIGDSITAGWNFPPGTNIVNAGVSGDLSEQMLARFDRDVMSHHPAIVSILAGTNDARSYIDPSIEAIAEMADWAASSGACVIIGTTPPNSVWGVNGITAQMGNRNMVILNGRLKLLDASFGYFIADYRPALALPDGSIDDSLYVDGIHPNDSGHDKMWQVVEPPITRCKLRLGLTDDS